MNKHRVILYIIAALAAAMLVSCSPAKPGRGGADFESSEEENRLIVVGFSQVGSESSWRVANSESMKAAFCEANGYELIFDDAKQKQENQYKAVRTFIQQKVDYIVLAPVTESGWDDVLKEAKRAGIPVIIVDRQVDSSPELYTSWVGSDFLNEGQKATAWLDRELKAATAEHEMYGASDDGNETAGTVSVEGIDGQDSEAAANPGESANTAGTDSENGAELIDEADMNSIGEAGNGTVQILHLKGTLGATSQLLRTKGLEDAVEAHEGWQIVKTLDGDYTEAKAYELTKQFLSEGGEADVIYSENDNMTFGVMRALDEFGITYGRGGEVILISFDAVRSALEECLAGRINLCVECNPLHGPRVANLIEQLEKGEKPQKFNFVEENYYEEKTLTRALIDTRKY